MFGRGVEKVYHFAKIGIGDDLMVFWALVAAVKAQIITNKVTVYFERKETREFLKNIGGAFPEIHLSETLYENKRRRVVYVRGKKSFFPGKPVWNIIYLLVGARFEIRLSSFHKLISEFGGACHWRIRNIFAAMFGATYFWSPPYPACYDGWQEVAIGYKIKKKFAVQQLKLLGKQWKGIIGRLQECQGVRRLSNEVLLFPDGGSFQDFDDVFILWLRQWCSFKVVRFCDDQRSADLKYRCLRDMQTLISNARVVITNDSVSSHLAQFFASKHILICTRSRPDNVCFPCAENTYVLDWGKSLRCRPCAYLPRAYFKQCAAGHNRCFGQLELTQAKEYQFIEALQWADIEK